MYMVTLPKLNDLGFFEIRLESIGGLGANLAGKMLAEAGVVGVGLNGVSFSSYGSEKKGSPVKAHIRFCYPDTNIRDTTPVERPHVVGIFHEALSKTVNVINGIYEDSTVLVNSRKTPAELKETMNLVGGTIAVIDATGIALEEKNRVNMAMLGGLFRLCDFLDPETMKAVIRKSLEKNIRMPCNPPSTRLKEDTGKSASRRLNWPKDRKCRNTAEATFRFSDMRPSRSAGRSPIRETAF